MTNPDPLEPTWRAGLPALLSPTALDSFSPTGPRRRPMSNVIVGGFRRCLSAE